MDRQKLSLYPHANSRPSRYPNGAYKLLVILLYGQYPYMERLPRGIIQLSSPRKLGKLLGVESRKIHSWLDYLENMGYLSSLVFRPDRTVTFQVREPSSVIY